MGIFGFLFFGDDDKVIIEQIAKIHNLPKDVVEEHYKKFLEGFKDEIKK